MAVVVTPTLLARYDRYKQIIQATEAGNPILGQYPGLLAGVLATESGFQPGAIHADANGTEDVGIAQLNSAYYPTATAQDPTAAIQLAGSILANNIASCGSVEGALYKYNSGSCSGVGADRSYPSRVFAWAEALAATPVSYAPSHSVARSRNPSGLPKTSAAGLVLVGLGIILLLIAAAKLH